MKTNSNQTSTKRFERMIITSVGFSVDITGDAEIHQYFQMQACIHHEF